MERETEKLAVKRFPPRIHANDVVAGVTPCYAEINTANAGVAKLADAPDLGFDETSAASRTWPSEFTGQSQNAARTCKPWIQAISVFQTSAFGGQGKALNSPSVHCMGRVLFRKAACRSTLTCAAAQIAPGRS